MGWLDKITGWWENWNYPQDEEMKIRVEELLNDPTSKKRKSKSPFKQPPFAVADSAKNIPPNTDR